MPIFGTAFNDEIEAADQGQLVKGREYRRILAYFDHKHFLIISFIVVFIAGLTPLLFIFPLKKGTELFGAVVGFLDSSIEFIKEAAWISAICIFIQTASTAIQGVVAPMFLLDIRKKLYSALLNADISYFDTHSYGAMVSRISEGVSYIKDVYVDQIYGTIAAIALSLGTLILAFVFDWKITLMFIAFPIVLAFELWGGDKWSDKIWEQYKAAGTESVEKAIAVVTEFRTVKSFDQENFEAESFASDLYAEQKILNKVSIVRGATLGLALGILGALGLTLIWYLMKIMIHPEDDQKSLFDICVVANGIILCAVGIRTMLSVTEDLRTAKSSARNISAIIDREPSIKPDEGKELTNVKGKVEFRNVGFRYKGCEKWAVRHLSFVIEPGKTVAFVGESGCGKSTTLQLLQRFYDIDEGEILVDDIDITTVSPRSLRKAISIVPQSPVLFSMSIADNIRYSKLEANENEIVEAAKTGNAHNFIMDIPENYKTIVKQTSLSGGQKQRICISRAILSPTPILLLDEATAALDTESEQLVQQSLETFRHGKTSIMVAHRLATVVNADKIFVFQDGHIVETGTHEKLLKKGGIYADLAKYQLQ
ncbi:ABC transporter family protein [Histomonas meleagridis]|uniref:ABC transporter family protein n=1 Tax=Histomonas meleagridis TaxID=135588 RepID=UPI0035594335|nr:ABC transporter family protein [Histomonas meleagridis]KAH0803840.1 ABC transporter family protein [Histomonas meleagridis]